MACHKDLIASLMGQIQDNLNTKIILFIQSKPQGKILIHEFIMIIIDNSQ